MLPPPPDTDAVPAAGGVGYAAGHRGPVAAGGVSETGDDDPKRSNDVGRERHQTRATQSILREAPGMVLVDRLA